MKLKLPTLIYCAVKLLLTMYPSYLPLWPKFVQVIRRLICPKTFIKLLKISLFHTVYYNIIWTLLEIKATLYTGSKMFFFLIGTKQVRSHTWAHQDHNRKSGWCNYMCNLVILTHMIQNMYINNILTAFGLGKKSI